MRSWLPWLRRLHDNELFFGPLPLLSAIFEEPTFGQDIRDQQLPSLCVVVLQTLAGSFPDEKKNQLLLLIFEHSIYIQATHREKDREREGGRERLSALG